jgi:hypothetical protein
VATLGQPVTTDFKAALKTSNFMAQSPITHLLRCYHKDCPTASIVRGRRLAIVEVLQPGNLRDVLAFVSATTYVDDRVCFFRSCPVPFLLRRMPPISGVSLASAAKAKLQLDGKIRHVAEVSWMVPTIHRQFATHYYLKPYERGQWEVEHFRLVGECFVEGLIYGLARNLLQDAKYGKAKLIVLH